MKSLHGFARAGEGNTRSPARFDRRQGSGTVVPLVLLALAFGMGRLAFGQVAPAGDAGGLIVSAGGTASGYYLQYGERKMLGIAALVDADTRRRLGIEAEARWLDFHQTANVHTTAWQIGPRYHVNVGRFQPYVKGLMGIGQFYYPYKLARGNYLVVAPGAGVDFRLTRRIDLRLADFEYQYWPQFTYGAMSSFGVSCGLRVRVF